MRSRFLRWMISLATVVLLLPGCDDSDNAGAHTTLAATTAATTAAPAATTRIAAPSTVATTTSQVVVSTTPATSTTTAAVSTAYQPGDTTVTVSLDAVEGLGRHGVEAWVLPIEPNGDKAAIGGTSFGVITEDPFSDSRKLQPQDDDSYFDFGPGESPIVEPGTYRFIIEAYIPSGPMHYGCQMPIEIVEGESLTVTVSSLPTYTGDGWHWTPPGRQLGYPDCPVDGFDFSSDDLCEWFSADEIDTIVATAYEDNHASPLPPAFEESAVAADSPYSGCWWNSGDISQLGLIATEPVASPATDARRWQPHPALSEGVYVDQEVVVGSHGDWVPGVEVRLLVEGQELTMEYWHGVPPGFDGDAGAVLAIADEMLRQMGWVPTASP